MTTVEPIRNKDDLRKVEAILKKQSMRNLLFFTIGTNCGLRISDILAQIASYAIEETEKLQQKFIDIEVEYLNEINSKLH